MPPTKEELIEAVNEHSKILRQLVFEERNWEECKKTKTGLVISKRPSPALQGRPVFKADFGMDVDPARCLDLTYPTTEYYKRIWDVQIEEGILLEEIRHDIILLHNKMKPALKGLISARDAIDIFILGNGDEFKSIEFGSVEHDGYPPVKDYVRTWTAPSGLFMFPQEDPQKTKLVGIFEADVKSYVPNSIIDAGTPTLLVNYFEALKDSEKLDYKPLGEIPGLRKP